MFFFSLVIFIYIASRRNKTQRKKIFDKLNKNTERREKSKMKLKFTKVRMMMLLPLLFDDCWYRLQYLMLRLARRLSIENR